MSGDVREKADKERGGGDDAAVEPAQARRCAVAGG
jgi:hypothetical protein